MRSRLLVSCSCNRPGIFASGDRSAPGCTVLLIAQPAACAARVVAKLQDSMLGTARSKCERRCDCQLVRQIELSNLDRELQSLPNAYREPLVEHYIFGYSARQIAERMGLSSAAVEGRLRRGRQMLRERLAERGASLSLCVAGSHGCAIISPQWLSDRHWLINSMRTPFHRRMNFSHAILIFSNWCREKRKCKLLRSSNRLAFSGQWRSSPYRSASSPWRSKACNRRLAAAPVPAAKPRASGTGQREPR